MWSEEASSDLYAWDKDLTSKVGIGRNSRLSRYGKMTSKIKKLCSWTSSLFLKQWTTLILWNYMRYTRIRNTFIWFVSFAQVDNYSTEFSKKGNSLNTPPPRSYTRSSPLWTTCMRQVCVIVISNLKTSCSPPPIVTLKSKSLTSVSANSSQPDRS